MKESVEMVQDNIAGKLSPLRNFLFYYITLLLAGSTYPNFKTRLKCFTARKLLSMSKNITTFVVINKAFAPNKLPKLCCLYMYDTLYTRMFH